MDCLRVQEVLSRSHRRKDTSKGTKLGTGSTSGVDGKRTLLLNPSFVLEKVTESTRFLTRPLCLKCIKENFECQNIHLAFSFCLLM